MILEQANSSVPSGSDSDEKLPESGEEKESDNEINKTSATPQSNQVAEDAGGQTRNGQVVTTVLATTLPVVEEDERGENEQPGKVTSSETNEKPGLSGKASCLTCTDQ